VERHFRAMKIRRLFVTSATLILKLTWPVKQKLWQYQVEIKPQVDKYTIDGKEVLILAEGR
jgi:adenosylhomocysteinase